VTYTGVEFALLVVCYRILSLSSLPNPGYYLFLLCASIWYTKFLEALLSEHDLVESLVYFIRVIRVPQFEHVVFFLVKLALLKLSRVWKNMILFLKPRVCRG